MSTRIVTYFTAGTSYEDEANRLIASVRRVGMETPVAVGVADGGNWYANTAAKAEVLFDQRRKLRGPLLYIDADAVVHQNCAAYFDDLARRGYDFGAHYFEGSRLLSGTLFLGDTNRCLQLLAAWRDMNQSLANNGVTQGGGQKNLWFLTTCMADLKIFRLPGRFCYVFDKPHRYPAGEPRIIEHLIASREHRSGKAHQVHEGRQRRIAELDAEMKGGAA